MRCRTIPLGDGVAIICSRGRRETCQTPGCGGTAVALCDWPLAAAKAGKTCDRRMCAKCRRVQGPEVDYCESHDRIAKARTAGLTR